MIALGFVLMGLAAATTNAAPTPAENSPQTTNALSAPEAPPAAPVLHEVSPGVFDYHGVLLDKKKHRITFPAKVNQVQGLVEYLLVNELGKLHESLLSTKIQPRDIHLALLLIGLPTTANLNSNEAVPPSAIDSAYLHAAPKLKGTPVTISLAWTQDGKKKQAPAEAWIFNLHTNHLMTPGTWTYNGSLVENGVFLADEELSIAAVITDPTALVNNPREGYDDDQIWQVQGSAIPPMDMPVDVSITLTATKP